MINNVREQQFENSSQPIAIVKKIVKNIDKNVTVTRAYRTGAQPGNSQINRPIIASLLDKQQRLSVVRHVHRLKYTEHRNVNITETCAKNGRQHGRLNSHYIMKKGKNTEMFIFETKC